MSLAKLVAACALVAIALSACGSTAKPIAGSPAITAKHPGRGVVDDPRATHLKCLEQHHLPVVTVGQVGLQIGAPGTGPSVSFAATPGSAQALQIDAQVQAAEVIGSAVLYPNQASDHELQVVEDCLAVGVKG